MIQISEEDIVRYSQPGPRYTSYPTVPVWTDQVGPEDLRDEIRSLGSDRQLSLYLHIPFCEKLCHFCACNRVIDKNRTQDREYLRYLKLEMDAVRQNLVGAQKVVQMHWGGGTPTFLSPDQLAELTDEFFDRFTFEDNAELSIEVNPVVTRREHLERLSESGFNRISMGVQDFDLQVQDAINRHQTYEQTKKLVEDARELGFESVNLDLVYGLPKQTQSSVKKTIEQVLTMRPERIALYSFAKVPWKQPFQRRFLDSDLPEGLDKISLYLMARELFLTNGYEAIGMDHFALPGDEIAQAMHNRVLHRNFMGYTTKPDTELIGLGVSSISSVGSVFAQNEKKLPSYYEKISQRGFATHLGHRLSHEDKLRRRVILELMCNFEVSFARLQKEFGIQFVQHFQKEMPSLRDLEREGMIRLTEEKLEVVGRGQVLVRNIAMVFDQYLPTEKEGRKFSNTI